MTTLGRRVDALEAIAEEVSTRPIRRMVADLAVEYGLTPAETAEAMTLALAEAKRVASERDAMLRAGHSEREILERFAAQHEKIVAEVEADSEALHEKYYVRSVSSG